MSKEISFSENILSVLDSLFADGRCPHAVLIDGGGELQRESLARLTAKMIVCNNSERTPCGACESCRKADEDIHPDIITVRKPNDKKSFLKADVKKVVADAYLTPNDSARKVYILAELQDMTEESQNLLLKILEEPPSYTAFVLTSYSANAVIGTVLSRVSRIRLGKSGDIEYSDKAKEIVSNLSSAVNSSYEYDKIKALAPAEGNKALIVEVMELFIAVLRDAMAIKSSGEILVEDMADSSTQLSDRNNMKSLLDMYDAVCGVYRTIDNNPNYTLLSAVLCARL
jgi:DNA polymerase III delta prime subunit